MKLTDDVVNKFIDIVATANSIGIDRMIIDSESIRGQSESTAVILLDKNTINFGIFSSIGISRVKLLNSRLNLVKNGKNIPTIEFEIKEKDNGDREALLLSIKEKKTTVEFRCCDPAHIRAARNLKSSIIYTFDIDEESINVMSRGMSVMGNNNISFRLDNGKVQFNLSDVEGDSLNHIISDSITINEDETPSFYFKYNKSILQLLKLAMNENTSTATVNITKRGVLNLMINNLSIYQPPEN